MLHSGATMASDTSFAYPAALFDACWRTRRQAVEKLAKSGNRGTPLLGEALGDRCASVRLSVVEALKFHANKRAENALLAALGDRKSSVRRAAAEAVAGRGTPRVVAALMGRLRDSAPKVREAALVSLASSADRRALAAISHAFGDPDEDVRLAAAMALGSMGERALAGLVRILKETRASSDSIPSEHRVWARLTAILLLKAVANADATREVIKALADTDPSVRRSAVVALRDLRCTEAIPGLVRACSDPDESVKTAADEALLSLCAEDEPTDDP